MNMAVGRIFQEYSVICMFGSVVGLVVVPLIAQSIESLIFSAIVVTLTAKTLSRHVLASPSDPQPKEESQRRGKEKERDKDERKVKRKKTTPPQPTVTNEKDLHRRDHDLHKQEELKEADKERRQDEKKSRKAQKKKERLRRREEERKEKQREVQLCQQRQEVRTLKKQQEKEAKQLLHEQLYGHYQYTSSDWSQLDTAHMRPIRRERKHSTSSSASSSSTPSTRSSLPPHSHPRHPYRASSDPQLITSHHSPSPSPHPPSPSQQTRAWQCTPPPPQPSHQWNPGASAALQHQHVIQRLHPNNTAHAHIPYPYSATMNPPLTHVAYPLSTQSLWMGGGLYWTGQHAPAVHPEIVKSQSYEALNQTTAWVPGPPSDPTVLQQRGVAGTTAVPSPPLDPTSLQYRGGAGTSAVNTHGPIILGSFGIGSNDGCYSLFSGNGRSPFSVPSPSTDNTPLSPVGGETMATVAPTAGGTSAGDSTSSVAAHRKEREYDDWPLL